MTDYCFHGFMPRLRAVYVLLMYRFTVSKHKNHSWNILKSRINWGKAVHLNEAHKALC
jgi:hypothetical protein